jgi:hypothetical protein
MIFFWVFGDVFKLFFLVLKQQPIQFITGIVLELGVEGFLLGQYFIYSKNDESRKVDSYTECVI